ncbi:E3 ubiquitin-protein ligase TRIM48 [Lepus europaeus]|uniref:E3 ubiquitin-protein ligase TRIM48 n=1 Tax=Lepus europaeus TaxID=9983 RepID=UPI002B49AAA8|nr:E3 ubiquitin-protein ligase TRIM48 [Lepus europaeus]
MDSRVLHIFQKELTYPICRKYFIDPVTIDCGHSFCRPCLYLCLQEKSVLNLCLECKRVTDKRDFKTNISIKNLKVLIRKASLQQFLSSEEHTPVVRKETKKIFCKESKNLLCLLCSDSQEHQGHRHLSMDWAAEEHRETLLKTMKCLWKNLCKNSRTMNIEIIKAGSWEVVVLPPLTSPKLEINIRTKYESMLLHMPQPMNLELSAMSIIRLIETLRCFKDELQPIAYIPDTLGLFKKRVIESLEAKTTWKLAISMKIPTPGLPMSIVTSARGSTIQSLITFLSYLSCFPSNTLHPGFNAAVLKDSSPGIAVVQAHPCPLTPLECKK